MGESTHQNLTLKHLGEKSLVILGLCTKSSLIASAEIADAAFEIFRYKSMHEALFPSRVKTITNSLKQSGLLEGNSRKGYRLTNRGNWELARRRMQDNPEHHIPEKWDNQWRVVIFDVPEIDRKYRDVLRRAIAGYGMYQLQKSVWAYPYPCDAFLRSVQEDLGFRSEVLYMLVDKIDHQKELEREFNLR
jgi:DNA-binding transcriptional regulator PaaX